MKNHRGGTWGQFYGSQSCPFAKVQHPTWLPSLLIFSPSGFTASQLQSPSASSGSAKFIEIAVSGYLTVALFAMFPAAFPHPFLWLLGPLLSFQSKSTPGFLFQLQTLALLHPGWLLYGDTRGAVPPPVPSPVPSFLVLSLQASALTAFCLLYAFPQSASTFNPFVRAPHPMFYNS